MQSLWRRSTGRHDGSGSVTWFGNCFYFFFRLLYYCSITSHFNQKSFRSERTHTFNSNRIINWKFSDLLSFHWIFFCNFLFFSSSHRNRNIHFCKIWSLVVRTFMFQNLQNGKLSFRRISKQSPNNKKKTVQIDNPENDASSLPTKITVWLILMGALGKCADAMWGEQRTGNGTLFLLLKSKTDRCWTTPNGFYIWFGAQPVRRGAKGFQIFFYFYSFTFQFASFLKREVGQS